jgi:HD-GYP domain-containing protein (c-di-GMP phosphodiesterase class II)
MLFRRLLIAGLVTAVGLGLAVLLYERDRVSEAALEQSRHRAELFAARYDHLFADPDRLDGPAINTAIREFAASQDQPALGQYVYLGVFTFGGRLVTEGFSRRLPVPEAIRREVAALREQPAPADESRRKIMSIDGRPWLRVSFPLAGRTGRRVGVVKGIFAFSDDTVADFRLRGLRTMAGVIGVALLTTAVVYPVVRRLTGRVTEFSIRLLDANLETLALLGSAIAKRDSDTNAHNYRVTIYSVRLAETAGLPPPTIRSLIKGAFLHDVGKIGIPDGILLKPGKLDDAEYAIMKTHVEHGREIVSRSRWLEDALDVVYAHHEQVEGRGYPRGLTGSDIPIAARIFAIADVFDALTSRRPYKDPWPYEKAMDILAEGRGTHFDPELLDAFGRIARPLHERIGSSDDVPDTELKTIVQTYFNERMDSFDA